MEPEQTTPAGDGAASATGLALPAPDETARPAGTRLLQTWGLKLLLEAGPIAVRNKRIILADGPSGAGKTTAIEEFLRTQPGFYAKILEGASKTDAVGQIMHAFTGRTPRTGLRIGDLTSQLRMLFAQQPGVLAIDEAQNLPRVILDAVRQRVEDQTSQTRLLLAGVGIFERVDRLQMFPTRCGLRVPFERLPDQTLAAELSQLHPLFATTSPRLLEGLDGAVCHGVLRSWIVVLEWLLEFTDNGRLPVTKESCEDVARLILGRPVKL